MRRRSLTNELAMSIRLISLRARSGNYPRAIFDWPLVVSLLIVVIFLTVAIVLPLAAVLGTAFSIEGVALLARYLSSSVYLRIVFNTFELGILVGFVGTAVGFLFAFVQVRVDVPFKRLLHWVALLPIVSPPFAVAASAIILFGVNGLISHRLLGLRTGVLYGLGGLVLAQVLSMFTIAYLNLVGMMRALDPSVDEAATNLGANKWDIFRKVSVPLLIPGIASSFLLVFVESIADVANPLVLGGDVTVLASRIYLAIMGEYDVAAGAVLSLILLLPSLLVYLVQRYWSSRRSVVSVTGRPSGRSQLITHPAAKWTLFAVTLAFVLLILVVYGTVLVGAFTQLIGLDNRLTLDHFAFVLLGLGSKAIVDTTLLSACAAVVASLLGVLIAWFVARHKVAGSVLLDLGTMLGIAVPGIVVGLGYMMCFRNGITTGGVTILPSIQGGSALAGGAIAIVLAYIVRSTPGGVRAGVAALQQIDPSIEEAAITLGADNVSVFRRVTLPLVNPALLAGLAFGFTRSMTSVSAILFLVTPETEIMTVQILNEVDAGRFGNAFAYSVILTGIVVTTLAILNIFVRTARGLENEWVGIR